MNEEYKIVQVEKPDDNMWEVIGGGIHNFNEQHAGEQNYKRICFVLHTPEGEVAGGLIGEIYWDWFYVDLLFIKEELRRHGYGGCILTLSEEEARKSGATHAFLDTFSFQSPDFYKKHGYQVFGELKDFPPGHTRYYLTKQL